MCNLKNLLCDYLFWGYVDEFALTAEQLVQETIHELFKLNDPKIILNYKLDILSTQSKVERLASNRPGRRTPWQMDLAIYSLEEFQIRRFTDNLTLKNRNSEEAESSETSLKEKMKLISNVQSELNRLGCNAGKPDGVIGPISRKALKVFSSAVNIIYDEKNFRNENFLSGIIEIDLDICQKNKFDF